jgi:hypothetical protein
MSEGSTLPDPPSAAELHDIGIRDDEFRRVDTNKTGWRLLRTEGPHVLAWNAFRHFGPVLRFDPHPPPRSEHPEGRMVGASTPGPALGEAIHVDRAIDRSAPRPALSDGSFVHAGAVRLGLAVDGPGAWATRAGGPFAISTAPHAVTQQWARAVVEAFPGLHGVHYKSRFAGGDVCGAVRADALGDADAAGCFLTVDPPRSGWPTRRRGSPYRLPSHLTSAGSWRCSWIATGTLRRCASRLSHSKDRRGQSRSRYLALREAIAGGQLAIDAAS